MVGVTDKGAHSEPQLSRTYRVELNSGHRMVYIASELITRQEAAKRLKAKFGQGGKFIK